MSIKCLTAAFAMLFSAAAMSQQLEDHNMAKVNLSAFALKSFQFQYERQVSHRVTIALGYSKIPNSSLPFHSAIENLIKSPEVKVNDFSLGSSVFTPEFRYYYGRKGAFHGFYLSLYGRFGKYELQGPIEYTTADNEKSSALFSGNLNTYSAGVLIGSSFNLSQRIYLDWWILGVSAGAATGSFRAPVKLSSGDQASLQNTLNNLDIPFAIIDATVTGTEATVKTTGNIAGLRGLGINLGVRF